MTSLSLQDVHRMSTFELRKECVRRGLALPEVVNGTTLLQTVVSALVRDQDEIDKKYAEKVEREQKDLRERLEREKLARKAAALERSRLRQENQQKEQR